MGRISNGKKAQRANAAHARTIRRRRCRRRVAVKNSSALEVRGMDNTASPVASDGPDEEDQETLGAASTKTGEKAQDQQVADATSGGESDEVAGASQSDKKGGQALDIDRDPLAVGQTQDASKDYLVSEETAQYLLPWLDKWVGRQELVAYIIERL